MELTCRSKVINLKPTSSQHRDLGNGNCSGPGSVAKRNAGALGAQITAVAATDSQSVLLTLVCK